VGPGLPGFGPAAAGLSVLKASRSHVAAILSLDDLNAGPCAGSLVPASVTRHQLENSVLIAQVRYVGHPIALRCILPSELHIGTAPS
jgi:hypothetical protein